MNIIKNYKLCKKYNNNLIIKNDIIINKGYNNAGGKNTNKNGFNYEYITDLNTEYNIINKNKYHNIIQFHINKNKIFQFTKQNNLFKYMKKHIDIHINKAHGCKNPDECFINNNNIFIIEKKFQQVNGSVCEKIQTPDFKLWQYSRTFPNFNIIYIYCLSTWFKDNCKAELEYLEYKNIPFFFGDNENYKKMIVNYIVNYK